MTHSLHREGTVESLEGDFLVLGYSTGGINDKGSYRKIARMIEKRIRKITAILTTEAATRQASSGSLLIKLVKIGIKAEAIAPKIRILKIRSGIRKAA